MYDIFLILIFFTIFAVVWIEWIPERYRVFSTLLFSFVVVSIGIRWLPAWYGWIALSLGLAQLVWIYFSPRRRMEWPEIVEAPIRVLQKYVATIGSRVRHRETVERTSAKKEKTSPLRAPKIRNVAGAVFAVVSSPIAALPSAIVLSVILFVLDAVYGNALQVDGSMQESAKQVLGVAVVVVFATADLFARYFLVCVPLLFAGGYAVSASAIGSGFFWRRYFCGLLLLGTMYSAAFLAAQTLNWFDGPFFN